jgi:hypothetical protein
MKNIFISLFDISSIIRRVQALENISYSPLDISAQSEECYSFFIRNFEAEWSIYFIPHQTFQYMESAKNITHSSLNIFPPLDVARKRRILFTLH